MFSIHSVNSDRQLTFSSFRDEQFQVEFIGAGIHALTGIWVGDHFQSLIAFFDELAGFKEPWKSTPTWESLESEFSLSAKCTALGQVTFVIAIRHDRGGLEAWSIQASIVSELGQLEKIAREVKAFFQEESA